MNKTLRNSLALLLCVVLALGALPFASAANETVVLHSWTASTADKDSKVFVSNLVSGESVKVRWNENGTMYTKAELQDLRAACDECGIPLFLDGARMGYALCAPGNDLFMEDYAALCDVFYIGGTKCGMLMGEAVVICNPALQKDFRYLIKQKGGMLAKGRLLGVQFEEMFKDGLYEEACGHGIKMALKLKQGLVEKGYEFLFDSNSNQQFPILTEEKRAQLAEKYEFAFWERVDENRVGVRFCTSWATKESAIDALLADL